MGEHFFHLLILGAMAVSFISYVLRGNIKKINYFAITVLLVLFAFSLIRAFPCHLLSSNPQDSAQTNTINHPCCLTITNASVEISIAPAITKLTHIEQKPYLPNLQQYVNLLANKSPPLLS